MDQETLTEYSGSVGAILRRSMSWSSLITGMFLGFVLLAATFLFTVLNAPNALSLFIQLVLALSLARFAVNGLFGEWGGTIFSSTGGPWSLVSMVTLRYLVLTAIWLVPLFFFVLSQLPSEQALAAMMMSSGQAGPGMNPLMGPMPGMGKIMFAFAVYMLGSVVTPPVFLIVSVSANGFGDIFSPEHWRSLFSGRIGDLFMIYAVYAGALGMSMILGLPIILALVAMTWKLAVFFGAIGLAFVCGLAVNLLGRLCGFFAFGDAGLSPSAGATDTGSDSDLHRSGPASLAPVSPTTSPAVAPASSVATADVAANPDRTIPLSSDPAARLLAHAAAEATGGPPPLMDSQQHVDEAMKQYDGDPSGAIRYLEEIRDKHAPHPQVLHALCLMSHKSDRTEEALCFGKEGIPLSIERGHSVFAAEMFRALWPLRDQLSLTRDQLLSVAGGLVKQGDLTYGANTYALILQQDTKETRAVKGILQVADRLLQKSQKPADALRLYRYLQKHCSDSPLLEYMQQGAEDAEKRIAQSKAS